MQQRILIAGVGNIFLGDDGFGVEVIKRTALEAMPEWVRVADFGIKGIHLAFELLDQKYETIILVDAAPRGGAPGTVYLIEPDLDLFEISKNSSHDAHAMNPQTVLETVRSLGEIPRKIYIVGCEPVCTEEGMGLSEPVSQAVEEAVRLILEIVARNAEPDREANESLTKPDSVVKLRGPSARNKPGVTSPR
jgi:hydrogenase maturation protease